MSLSVNSVAPQSVNDTIELTWYEDSYTTMVLPDGTFSFAQGETVYYNWESGDFPQFFSRSNFYSLFSGTAEQSNVGDYTFVLSATVDEITYEQVTIHLTVLNVNDAPLHGTGALKAIPDQTANAGDFFSFSDTSYYFRDLDPGDVLTYSATLSDGSDLPDWLDFDAATGTFSGTPASADAGTISVKVTATDLSNATISDTFDITVSAPANTAPTGSPTAVLVDGTEDQVYSVLISDLIAGFSDADNDLLEVTNFSATNATFALSSDGKSYTVTPTANFNGKIVLSYTVSDGRGGTIDTELDVNVAAANDAPVLESALSDQAFFSGEAFTIGSLASYFSDADDDTLTYSATLSNGSDLPDWLTFDADTASFSGTAPRKTSGTYEVTVTATDGSLATISDTFEINFTSQNSPPRGKSELSGSIKEDKNFSVKVADLLKGFRDPDGDVLSVKYLKATQGGEDLSVKKTGDKYNFTPIKNSESDIVITYRVSDDQDASVAGKITINVDPINDPAALNKTAEDQLATEDKAFRYDLPENMFTDPDKGDKVDLKATLANGSALPGWLKFTDNGDGSGYFSGKPKNENVGKIEVKVAATDGGASDTFFINVKNTNDAPSIQVESTIKTISVPTSDFKFESSQISVFQAFDRDMIFGKDSIKVVLEKRELGTASDRGEMASAGNVDVNDAFRIRKIVGQGENLYELVTTKKTNDFLEDAGKKIGLTITVTDKTGATDDIDLTFKIKHVPNAAHGDQADHAILVMDDASMAHGAHDWAM